MISLSSRGPKQKGCRCPRDVGNRRRQARRPPTTNHACVRQPQGRRQRGGRRGLQPPYCLRNKRTLLQPSLKFSAINECLGVEEGVHTLALHNNGALFHSPLKFFTINDVFLVSRSRRRCSAPLHLNPRSVTAHIVCQINGIC
jgi:hypothetical protein